MSLSFDERFALLVDREHAWRKNRRVSRLLREAKLKSSQACMEDVQYGAGRKLDKSLIAQLASCQWIHAHQNLIPTGATGCGKTWLACALGVTRRVGRGCRWPMYAPHVCLMSYGSRTAMAASANACPPWPRRIC